ncbi:MAG: hypothetical protein JWM80_6170 [Cyanobacteria bacterium RYN_339]|nr:hypothetical protein [Cyanobacteria bacterium RYN_339]
MTALSRLVAVALCLALMPACSKKEPLTDDQVTKYIQAYTAIREVAPDLAGKVGKEGGGLPEAGQAGFGDIEKAVKDAGFKNYPEFVRVNAAVAWSFSQGQGQAFMAEMSDAHKNAYAKIDEQLANPAVPAEAKAELTKAKAEIEANYTKSKGWADIPMKLMAKLSDKDSVDVVMRHRKELEAAFTAKN